MLRTISLSLCKSSSRKIVTSIIGKESINRSFTSCLIRCQQQDSMESDLLANIPTAPFNPEVSKVLMAPIDETDIEVLPEGSLFLPEIKVCFSLQVLSYIWMQYSTDEHWQKLLDLEDGDWSLLVHSRRLVKRIRPSYKVCFNAQYFLNANRICPILSWKIRFSSLWRTVLWGRRFQNIGKRPRGMQVKCIDEVLQRYWNW